MNHALAFALLVATSLTATPLLAQQEFDLAAPAVSTEVSVPAEKQRPAARAPAPATAPKAEPTSAKASDAQGDSVVENPLNTLAQKTKDLPLVPRIHPPLPTVLPAVEEPPVAVVVPNTRTGAIEIWPFTVRPGTGEFEFALGQVLVALALLLWLYRSFFLKTIGARRALTGVALACADEAVLAAHPELVGELAARLARVERFLARSKKRERAARHLLPELAGLVTRGTLEPFFALIEARTYAPGERAFPILRDLLQGAPQPQ
jgi:hypothetical protein